MSFRKIGKWILGSALFLTMTACSSPEPEDVKVLVPTGAPNLAVLGAYELDTVTVDSVEGTDILTSELAKKDGDYDIIVAPTNLGAKIYEKNPTYELESILTWGNLYMVAEEGTDLANATIAAFGQGAVPGLVFDSLYGDQGWNVTYYGSVQEAQQALLTGQVQSALIAQPAAAATIAKAKEQGKTLTILADLQKEWKEKQGMETEGYPQASLFVKKGSEEKVRYVLDQIESYLKEVDQEKVKMSVEQIGAETLGVPNADLAAATWEKQNIRYVEANQAKKDVESFLSLFGMSCPEGWIQQ